MASTFESAEDLLRKLTAGEEDAIRTVLALKPEFHDVSGGAEPQLIIGIRVLVRMAALVAVDASTATLRWAVEQACCTGADSDEIVAVLVAVGSDIGLARLVAAAPRLGLAMGYDIEVEGWDGC